MPNISAIIPTLNEEAHIEQAIACLDWADEIIVVDSFSTDNTPAIARAHANVRFIQHEYENSAAQKNWITPQASFDWIFILDADERVTPELKKELIDFKEGNSPSHAAYWIKRQNFFLGKKLRYTWKGDAVIRLFDRRQSEYEKKAVHAEIKSSGSIGSLKGKLEHHTVLTMERYLEKMERYSQWSASDYEKKTGSIGFYHLRLKPAYRFFKHYILEGGILDGKAGYVISKLMAHGVKRRYEIIKERRSL